jgi:hypothetical protein
LVSAVTMALMLSPEPMPVEVMAALAAAVEAAGVAAGEVALDMAYPFCAGSPNLSTHRVKT